MIRTPHQRICLGTAQLGGAYGIANSVGPLDQDSAYALLEGAHCQGVHYLDTATSYGACEALVGRFMKNKKKYFHVISKLPSPCDSSPKAVEDALVNSLQKLHCSRLEGYLIHNTQSYFDRPSIWDDLTESKFKGRVEKIGFSVYSPTEVYRILDLGVRPDIIQFPYSVLDQRFRSLLPELKKISVEVYVRSIFLQGAVFLPNDKLVGPLENARMSIQRLRELSKEYGLSVWDLCARYVLDEKSFDRIIMGVDSLDQLNKNLSSLEHTDLSDSLREDLTSLALTDENVINPTRWNL